MTEEHNELDPGNVEDSSDMSDLVDASLNIEGNEEGNEEEAAIDGLTIDDFEPSEESEEEEEEGDEIKTGIEEIDNLKLPEGSSADAGKAFKTMRISLRDARKEIAGLKEGKADPEEVATLKSRNETLERQVEASDFKSSEAYNQKFKIPASEHMATIGEIASEYKIPKTVIKRALELKGAERDELLKEHGSIAASSITAEIQAIAKLQKQAAKEIKDFNPTSFRKEETERLSSTRQASLTEALAKTSKVDPFLRESKNPEYLKGITDTAMKALNGELSIEEQAQNALLAQTSAKWRTMYIKLAQEHGVLKKQNSNMRKSKPTISGGTTSKSQKQPDPKRQDMDDLVADVMPK